MKFILEIILKLKTLMDNLEIYYKIYYDIINNYDEQNINNFILKNINYMNEYNNNLIIELTDIINNKDITKKFNSIINMFNKMTVKNISSNEKEKIQNIENKDLNKLNEDKVKSNESLINNNIFLNYDQTQENYENFHICHIKELNTFKN